MQIVGNSSRRRLEVVVVAAHAGRREPFAPARVAAGRASTRPRGRSRACTASTASITLREQSLLGAAHGDDDAELRRARVARVACAAARTSSRSRNGVHVDVGVEPHRLRAERAVLGARARLGVDEALELDLGAAPGEADLVRERDQRRAARRAGARATGERLVAGEAAALVEQGAFGGLERQRAACGSSRDRPWRSACGTRGRGRRSAARSRDRMAERRRSRRRRRGCRTRRSGRGAGAAGGRARRRRARGARPRRRPGAEPRRSATASVVEMGGQWIGPGQLRVNKLVAELGLETFPTYDDGENLLDLDGQVKRYTRRDPAARRRPRSSTSAQSQLRFDRLAKRVPLEAPWAADRAERWDEETFATWVRRNTRTARRAVLLGRVRGGGVRGRAAGHLAAARARRTRTRAAA